LTIFGDEWKLDGICLFILVFLLFLLALVVLLVSVVVLLHGAELAVIIDDIGHALPLLVD
jgi:hypothetical protein